MKPFMVLLAVILSVQWCCAQSSESGVAAQAAQIAANQEPLYKQLHAQPELSNQEEKTAKLLADDLEGIGLRVTRKVGGHGIVGVLKNGTGPTLLLRTDMDALPVTEQTGAP